MALIQQVVATLPQLGDPIVRKNVQGRVVAAVRENWPIGIARLIYASGPNAEHRCNVCGSHVARFVATQGVNKGACPVCGAFPRHRLMLLALEKRTTMFEGGGLKIIHIAPEIRLSEYLSAAKDIDYVTADLFKPRALRLDVEDMDLPDGSVDGFICSHVIEHLKSPERGIAEFFRVLKPGGFAAIMVPIRSGETIGDPAEKDPKVRARRFGQDDHFWYFGDDFAERLTRPGFEVEALRGPDLTTEGQADELGLTAREPLFLCRKPATTVLETETI